VPVITVLRSAGVAVAPSTYYDTKTRPPSARARRDGVLGPALRQLWEDDYRVYGVGKLWTAARRAGHDVGRDQVARLMRAVEACDYVASFPHLTGAISTFEGDSKEHHARLADRAAGLPWDGHLSSAGTMLVPAACHPSFATLPPEIPSSGQLMDVYGYCFRHEPATDPARMQAFRQHEYVLVDSPQQTQQHRDTWLSRAASVLDERGLEPAIDAVNDQFFGRAGKMLALNQRTRARRRNCRFDCTAISTTARHSFRSTAIATTSAAYSASRPRTVSARTVPASDSAWIELRWGSFDTTDWTRPPGRDRSKGRWVGNCPGWPATPSDPN
jgi:hypothetical protein